MAVKIQSIRGMHDILPEPCRLWQWLEDQTRRLLESYGYQQIRMPVVELTELFARSIGEVTDIVEKEMYSFLDRNGDSLSLRPEGTAGCVRACIEHGLLPGQTQRLWYQGPMFRHERPQKGRYRQFHQIGVESFGMPGPDVDIEMLLMLQRLWRRLGLKGVSLQLNSLGMPEERLRYREQLVSYLERRWDELDDDSRRRLGTNPLRVLDSKDPRMQAVIEEAPELGQCLGEASREHFQTLCSGLETGGVDYIINPRLVRGLDYYNLTVFEWVSQDLGAQGTICAGGRYDGLVAQLGGQAMPAIGFAMGIERLIGLLELSSQVPAAVLPHAYLVVAGKELIPRALALAERLREAVGGLRLLTHCGGGSMKSQFKKADRSGASCALVLGEREAAEGLIGIKPLREAGEQFLLTEKALLDWLPGVMAMSDGSVRHDAAPNTGVGAQKLVEF